METRIRQVRQAKGLTQRELAKKLGTTSGVVSRWENYPSRVNIPTLANLARVLECSPAELLSSALRLERPEAETMSEAVVVNIQAYVPGWKSSPFDKRYLAEVTSAPPDALVIVAVLSDTMLPTLSPGDFVMVDTTVKKITINGLYCLRIDDVAAIRRVSVHPVTNMVSLACDNPAYEILQNIRQEKLDIIGRVIWRCGKV